MSNYISEMNEQEPNFDEWPEPPQPWPVEDECAFRGHIYYGDDHPDAPDGMGGRCYCGKNRYPTGGAEVDLTKPGDA